MFVDCLSVFSIFVYCPLMCFLLLFVFGVYGYFCLCVVVFVHCVISNFFVKIRRCQEEIHNSSCLIVVMLFSCVAWLAAGSPASGLCAFALCTQNVAIRSPFRFN